ncbi:hypothetical protein NPIL_233521, partial [Nephila pilipes]
MRLQKHVARPIKNTKKNKMDAQEMDADIPKNKRLEDARATQEP